MKYLFLFLITGLSIPSLKAQLYTPKFDLQGHRGARGLMPENTIPAFLVALDSGVTTIELDLAVTKDKQLVVSHEPWMASAICLQSDSSIIREKDERSHNIYQLSYDHIKEYDCGSKGNARFPQQQKMKVAKPLLVDVIVAVEDHIRNYTQYEVDYNIEIKSSPEGDNKFHPTPEVFSDLLYETLDQYLPMARVVIQSFDFRVLQYWHKKYPHVRLAALVENSRSIEANLNDLGFKPSIYSPYFELLNKEKVRQLHQQKIRVIPWTVNDVKDMKHMLSIGVDGFITDYPDRAASLGLGIRRKI